MLSGCVLRSNEFHGLRSADALSSNYPADAHALALDVAKELNNLYAPGQTSLALVNVPGQFQESLEQDLRLQGFAVGIPPADITIGTTTDLITESFLGYAQVQTSDGQRFSISRKLTGGVLPISVPAPRYVEAALAEAAIAEPVVNLEPVQEKASLTPEKERAIYSATLNNPSPNSASPAATSVKSPAISSRTMLLPKAILSILPYNWKYTIPNELKRKEKVTPPANIFWRESLLNMALEAGCIAEFDDAVRRVTFADMVAQPSLVTSIASAHSPASTGSSATPASTISVASHAPASTITSSHAPFSPVAPTQQEPEAVKPPTAQEGKEIGKESAQEPVSAETLPNSPSLPIPVIEIWELQPGSLYAQLDAWASKNGYQLVWSAPDDLHMEASASFRGNFLECLQELFNGLLQAGYNLRLTVYQSNKVLEVRGE